MIGNRCGIEDDATYAGTSTVMGIKNGEFSLYGILGRAEEQLLVVDTDKPPYAKFTLEPLEELLDGDSEPEIPPPEPTNGPGDGPPKESNPGEGNGYVDSPTLPPSGFLPFIARSHTTSGASTLTDSANKETEKTYLPLPALTATPTTPSRPKLSLVTDLDSVMPFSTSIPAAAAISPPNIHISPPASPSMEPGHQHFSWNPPSAIPIFVDVYTPDAPTWDAKQGLRIDFGIDCLSPWSISSRSCSPFGGGARIPIAVSPSIFGGGFSKRGGVVSPGWIC